MNAPGAQQEPVEPGLPPNIWDLVPSFTICATDAVEAAAILRAIAHSAADSIAMPQVAADLEAYDKLAELLHYSAPPASAPAALEARLRSAIGQSAAPSNLSAASQRLPQPSLAPARTPVGPLTPRERGWHWPHTVALVTSAAVVLLLLLNSGIRQQ